MHERAVASWEQDARSAPGQKALCTQSHVALLGTEPQLRYCLGAAWSSRVSPFVPNRTGRTPPAIQTVKIKVSLFKLAASGGGFAVSVDPGTVRDARSPD